jgi:hypothetical protein
LCYFSVEPIKPEQLSIDILPPVVFNNDKFELSDTLTNINSLNLQLIEWLEKLNLPQEWIETNIKEIKLMEKNTELRSNIWIFHLEKNENTELTFEYILIKVNKDKDHININSDYNFFKQIIPTLYETYIYDYSSRCWLGVAGPRQPHYTHRPRNLHSNEIELVKSHVLKSIPIHDIPNALSIFY